MMTAAHNELFKNKTTEVFEILLQKNGKDWEEPDLQSLKKLALAEPLPYSADTEAALLIELHPDQYGWREDSEYPRFEWIAAVISSYLLYRQINVTVLIKFLKAIN